MYSSEDQIESQGQPDEHAVQVQQLFIRHQISIKAFILSLQPSFSEADDLRQETFLTVTRQAGRFELGTNFTAWAFGIARFKVLESRRGAGRHELLSGDAIEALAADAPEASYFEGSLPAVVACLNRLAPKARQIVELRYHGEQRPQEIATRLDWTLNAVNVALSKARNWLRQCVERTLQEGL